MNDRARFWAKVEKTDTCWLWTASTKPNGYGQFMRKIDGRWRPDYAHIVAYELLIGPVDRSMDMDHECRNKLCVRPGLGHVVPVTPKENRLRQIRDSLTRTSDGSFASLREDAME